MKKVHANFKGTPGTFAQFGDSITVTMAYWAPLAYGAKNLDPDAAKAHELVKKYMKPDCWVKWKGPDFGNNGSMTIRWAHDNVDKWLAKHNPETALIMFGTNDLGQLQLKEYEEKTRDVVQRCLKDGTVVILSTIPRPARQGQDVRRGRPQDRQGREGAAGHYFAEVLKRRPDDWDGAMAKFKEAGKDVYQVPTLISGDGVHPSNPAKFQDYSEESLKSSGYVLRNYLGLMAYAEVIRQVVQPSK
jgi:lysophospholipase L1-like esterase